jgi:hypothetical protein
MMRGISKAFAENLQVDDWMEVAGNLFRVVRINFDGEGIAVYLTGPWEDNFTNCKNRDLIVIFEKTEMIQIINQSQLG